MPKPQDTTLAQYTPEAMPTEEVLERAAAFDPTQVPAEAVLKTALKMIVQLHGCDLEMARDIAKLALREVA